MEIGGSPLNGKLIDKHEDVSNRGIVKGHLPLEHFFRFCRTLIKVTRKLGFHVNLKTADLQDLIYTTKSVDNNITIDR